MARKITIPITDHDDEDVCTAQYIIQYRMSGEVNWTTVTAYEAPVVLTNLQDDILYDVHIIRQCCDGVESSALEMSVNTTILSAPDNFAATPGDTEAVLDWDDVTDATGYTLERATDSGFTTDLTEVYTGTTSGYTDTELVNDTTYYYRVKATAAYHADSDHATLNTTPTAS